MELGEVIEVVLFALFRREARNDVVKDVEVALAIAVAHNTAYGRQVSLAITSRSRKL